MPLDQTNRRKHTRLPLSFASEFFVGNKKIFSGKTKDISFGGVFMSCRNATNEMIGFDGRLRIILQAGTENEVVELTGRIVRATGEGIGIQFISIGAEDYQRFRNVMLYNNPNPDILLKELKKHPGIDIAR
jgi:hypothetical protein